MTIRLSEPFAQLYTSPEYVATIVTDWVPWLLDGRDLGTDVVDLVAGPGPEVAHLRAAGRILTVAQAAPAFTAELADRFAADSDVELVDVDPVALPHPPDHFSAATTVLSLHHLPGADVQDRALAELARVLRPGGVLVGLNAIDGPHFRRMNVDGACVAIDPLTFADRLRRAGFVDVTLTVWSFVRFVARVPDGAGR